MPIFELFGAQLRTDFRLATALCRGHEPVDLEFTVSDAGRPLPPSAKLYESPLRTPAGASVCQLLRPADDFILRFAGVGDFTITATAVDLSPDPRASAAEIELQLLGPVLAFWLERRGLTVLHGSVVTLSGGGARAFAGASGAGKTSLAAACLAAGGALVADDLTVLTFDEAGDVQVLPGYPQLKAWPPTLERLATHAASERLRPESDKRRVPTGGVYPFASEPALLEAIHLIERGPLADVELTPLSPRDALVELLRQSFAARLLEAAGLAAERLERMARIAERVTVSKLRYPEGLDQLHRVVTVLSE